MQPAGALDKRITDLESVKEQARRLRQSFSVDSVTAVVDAKNQIINNVEIANNDDLDQWVRDHPEIPGDEKEAAIRAGVDAIRAANIEVVETAGSVISGKPPAAPKSPNAPAQDDIQYFGPKQTEGSRRHSRWQ